MGVLIYYSLLRISRQRVASGALLGLPITVGLLQCIVADVRTWACVAVCVAAAAGAVLLREMLDRKSGFAAAVTCSPVSPSELLWSKLLTAVAVSVVQMSLFAGVRAIWPGGGS